MKNKIVKLLAIVSFILSCSLCYAAKEVSWDKAEKYLNQSVTVVGKIVATDNTEKACFLNFNAKSQKNFAGIIFASDFPKFPPKPEKYYLNKEVKITGLVKDFQGRLAIIIKDPNQVQIVTKAVLSDKTPLTKKQDVASDPKALQKQIETLTSRTQDLEKKIAAIDARVQKLETSSKVKTQPARVQALPMKIGVGLSKNDVLRIYGKPAKMKTYELLGTTYDTWEYSDFRQVEFENEKVETWYGF